MNWTQFFQSIERLDVLDKALVNRKDYIQSGLSVISSETIENDHKLHYGKRSGHYFKINFEKEEFYIDKIYLTYFLADYQNQVEVEKKFPDMPYFGFEFMLNLTLARQTLSGLATYKEMLQNLQEAVTIGGICIENKVIEDSDELNKYLSSELYDFNGDIASEIYSVR